MKLNVYKGQNEVVKTFEVDTYDIMYGTVEDVLDILDDVTADMSDDALLSLVSKHRSKLNDLILDIFPEMDESDLRNIKVKELAPMFMELFAYVKNSFGDSMGKN